MFARHPRSGFHLFQYVFFPTSSGKINSSLLSAFAEPLALKLQRWRSFSGRGELLKGIEPSTFPTNVGMLYVKLLLLKKQSCWRELNSRPLPYQGSALPLSYNGFCSQWSLVISHQHYELMIMTFDHFFRAEDEVRTRDLQLGRLSLYQLSYFRITWFRVLCF